MQQRIAHPRAPLPAAAAAAAAASASASVTPCALALREAQQRMPATTITIIHAVMSPTNAALRLAHNRSIDRGHRQLDGWQQHRT
jgi:hypothetical protein